MKRGKLTPVFREDVAVALEGLLCAIPGVRLGKMFGLPGFYVGRRLFACVHGDGVGIRLPEERAKALIASGEGAPFRPYGIPETRCWVELRRGTPAAFRDDLALFREAMRFAASR